MADRPTEAEVQEFLDGLRGYRATIPERQQQMLDVIVTTTLRLRARAQEDAEVLSYWAAVNPPGPTGGYGPSGLTVNPFGPAGSTGLAWP